MFNGNSAETGGGGAAYLSVDLVEVLDSTIKGNQAADNGGGLAIVDTEDSSITSNTVTSNSVHTADLAAGAGIYIHNSGATFTNNFVLQNDNESGEGAGLCISGSSSVISMSSNVAAQNSINSDSAFGSGIVTRLTGV